MKTLLYIFVILMFACIGYGKSDMKVDKVENAKSNTFTVKGEVVKDHSSSDKTAWRFVHNGEILIVEPWYSGGMTFTPYKIVECRTLAIVVDEITALKLKLTESQERYIADIIDRNKTEKAEK